MRTLEWRDQIAALYLAQQPRLQRQVATLVNTTPENVEDACMFAWMQLLTRQLEEPTTVGSWLLTVARREAIKLDQRARRSHALANEVEPTDPVNRIGAVERHVDTAAVIAAAGLSARGQRLVALQAAGLSYTEIAERSGDSVRTVERQLLRARRKLREARSRPGG
ncbi:MAG: RNA polymerase sigma factor [Solirubrobacteraceae bacterium]